MAFDSLRDFMALLEARGELTRVGEEVSSTLEITEIQTRVIATEGPALLFENVIKQDGSRSEMPVLANLFGTVKRVAMGMDRKSDELRSLGEALAIMRQPELPKTLKDAIDLIPVARNALKTRHKIVKKAPVHEIILEGDEVDLNRLPIQTCWPDEPAPLITWPLVVTKGPGKGRIDNYNLGIYRMQLLSRNQTLMRWLKHRGGAQHHARWKGEKPDPLPAAAVIGADPAVIISAVTPLPETLSEYDFAALLRKKRLELVKCKTVPLLVPATAEIVLEGYVSLDDYGREGPYGDHTGYYNAIEDFPVFTVTAITMRKDPIYLSTYTGRPPDEPSVLGEALNDVFVPLLQQQFPEIIDFWLPPEGCSYRIAVVAIDKSYPGHAKRVMMAIWSYLRQFMYTKFVIVVDGDMDVRNWKDVMWAMSTNMDPARDMTIIENTPIDYLDFASPVSGLGSKVGLDATTKLPGESDRTWGRKIRMSDEVIELVTKKWPKLGLEGAGKPVWK